ncbi:hypothetical protein DOTSEDRAFT_73442 [Dothistroma septosporum NZE10]|uniref:Uncharacterized protein n=1 Tax=Dothistroma septosporum (strain NZE10 / CBS 128990) TaxID=675120 RepID=N1PJM4_DOTSN|nr:hypothetical protein DOTSEDRAFT_73442 [Dothistroma septosporum NZE10]
MCRLRIKFDVNPLCRRPDIGGRGRVVVVFVFLPIARMAEVPEAEELLFSFSNGNSANINIPRQYPAAEQQRQQRVHTARAPMTNTSRTIVRQALPHQCLHEGPQDTKDNSVRSRHRATCTSTRSRSPARDKYPSRRPARARTASRDGAIQRHESPPRIPQASLLAASLHHKA